MRRKYCNYLYSIVIFCIPVGNDLYPRSWERTERTATLDDPATQCLGNAKILYARSEHGSVQNNVVRKCAGPQKEPASISSSPDQKVI